MQVGREVEWVGRIKGRVRDRRGRRGLSEEAKRETWPIRSSYPEPSRVRMEVAEERYRKTRRAGCRCQDEQDNQPKKWNRSTQSAVKSFCTRLKLLLSNGDLLVVDLVVGASLLVLHVLGNEVLQVGLGLGLKRLSAPFCLIMDQANETHEFQLVHTLASVPMHVSLSPVHGRELLADTLEERLDPAKYQFC